MNLTAMSREQEVGRVIDSWLGVVVSGGAQQEGASWVLRLDGATDAEGGASEHLEPLLLGPGDPVRGGGHRDVGLKQLIWRERRERGERDGGERERERDGGRGEMGRERERDGGREREKERERWGGSFLLSSSTHNYTQPAVNHSAHFLFPAAEPAHQGNYSCVYHVSAFSQDLSSESRLLSVTVTGVRSDPKPFIIRAVVLPLTQLLVTIGLYFYCKATRGRRPSRQEDIELDYDDLGVPAEEEGAQGADHQQEEQQLRTHGAGSETGPGDNLHQNNFA
ncbi:hypothetical protein F7725_012223 [Dissostichus mawsoni]|uniref:Uncharacterized protein n=1 Tax=Dissostichus mawsoni TaxID=36200 RepID=A0A7J5YND1_DISMA|nr:hypothetical protein F7725_012223 [Dissostichus mawsoni]